MNLPLSPAIVLVGTQMSVNIGMCARAMLNCGLKDLRLVSPRDGWPNEAAIAPATGAADIVRNARAFDSIDEAIADCTRVFATSARVRDLEIPNLSLPEAIDDLDTHLKNNPMDQAAIIFGPESSGLHNETLIRADRLINYDLNPEFTSLNLAQAVLLFSWEWWNRTPAPCAEESEKTVVRADLNHFIERLDSELQKKGFYPNELKRPSTLQSLRAFFTRANPTDRELRGLQGVLTSLSQPKK